MKKCSKRWSGFATTFMVMAFCFGMSIQAQQKSVRVKVITNGNESEITIDTTIVNDEVLKFEFNDHLRSMNIDSIIKSHSKDREKMMEVMDFKMDSFPDMNFNFDFDGDMEQLHSQLAQAFADKGVMLEELKKLRDKRAHQIIIVGDDEGQSEDSVMVQSFVDDDGNHVKIIKKRVRVGDGGEDEENTIIIGSSRDGGCNTRHLSNEMTINVDVIPMEEMAFLKKLGFSKKALLNEPLNVQNFKVKVEKKIENDLKQMFVAIECLLPEDEGDCELQMIQKDGEVKAKEENMPGGEVKKQFEVQEEEAPYYFILSKNNRLFGRKISL